MKVTGLLPLLCSVLAVQPTINFALQESLVKTATSVLFPFAAVYLVQNPLELTDSFIEFEVGGLAVEINLTETQLLNFTMDFANSGIGFSQPKYIELAIRDLKAFVGAEYNITIGGALEVGHGIFDIDNTQLNASFYLYTATDNALQLGVQSISLKIGNIGIQMPVGSIMDSILEQYADYYIPTIERLLYELVANYTPTVNELLTNISYVLTVDALNFDIDLHPAENLTVSNGFLEGGVVGEITNVQQQHTYPVPPKLNLPRIDSSSSQPAQMIVGDYVLESALWCLWDVLRLPISSLPAPLSLTTGGLSFLIPQLQEIFGRDKNVTIVVSGSSSSVPKLWIDNAIYFNGTVTLDLLVDVDGSWQKAVSLDLALSTGTDLKVKDATVTLDVFKLDLVNLRVYDSQIGELNTSSLERLLGLILNVLRKLLPSLPIDFEFPKIPYIKITSDVASVIRNYLEVGITLEPNFL